jgi:hypothetical protein
MFIIQGNSWHQTDNFLATRNTQAENSKSKHTLMLNVAEILGVLPTAECLTLCFAYFGFDLHVSKYLDIYGVKWNIQVLNNILGGKHFGQIILGRKHWLETVCRKHFARNILQETFCRKHFAGKILAGKILVGNILAGNILAGNILV